MKVDVSNGLAMPPAGLPAGQQYPSTSEIEIRTIFDFCRRRWPMIAGAAVLGAVLAMSYVASTPKQYTAVAELLLETKPDKLLNQLNKDASGSESTLDSSAVDTEVELIQSSVLLRKVVQNESLVADPEFGPSPLTRSILSWFREQFDKLTRKSDGAAARQADDIQDAADRLRSRLRVYRSGKTYVLGVAMTSLDPQKAARIANAVSQAYIEERRTSRYDQLQRDGGWLRDRLDGLRDQLKQSEDAVARFRAENNLIQTRNSTVNEQQLADLNGRLVAAQAETAEKRARLDQAERVKTQRGAAASIPEVLRSPLISRLRDQDTEIARKEADLTARYGPQYPLVVNVRAERRNVQSAISAEIDRILGTIRNDFDIARAREDALAASLREISNQSSVDERTAVRLRELERTAAANKAVYEDFLTRAKLTQEQSTLETREGRVITPATAPWQASWPKPALTVAMGVVLGLLAGLAAAIGVELNTPGFTTPRQIEDATQLPVLATIFKVRMRPTSKGRTPSPAFLVAEKPLSRFTESIRSIWVGLRTSDMHPIPQIVAVTSAFPGEGKSTVALSMALAAVEVGSNVLLVDADMRRPSLSKLLDRHDEIGLSDFLAGSADIRDVITRHPDLGVFLLMSGQRHHNPSGLLSSARIGALLKTLRSVFDVIIIDTAPVGPVTDGTVLAQFCDKVVFVTAWNKTPRDAVLDCLRRIPGQRKLAGVVLNMVDEKRAPKQASAGYYGLDDFKHYYSE